VKSRHQPVCTRSLRVRQQQTEIKSAAVDWIVSVACGCGWLCGEVVKRSSVRRRLRFRKSSERRIPAAFAEVRGRWLEPTRAAVPCSSRRSARAQRRVPSPAGFDRWAPSGGRAPSAARRRPIRTRPLWALLGTERGTGWALRRPRCQAEVPEFVSSSAQRAKCPTPKDIGRTPPPLEAPRSARSAARRLPRAQTRLWTLCGSASICPLWSDNWVCTQVREFTFT
jgi:hypothetical protein